MYKVIKRLADLFFSVVLLVLGIIPGLIIAIIIKLDSPGPVFFKQKRYGKDMKVFEIYKFRTMKVNVPHNLPTRTQSDLIITSRDLEKSSDELVSMNYRS